MPESYKEQLQRYGMIPKDSSLHTALKMSVRIAQLARERGMDPGKTLMKIQYHREQGQLKIPEMDE